MAQPESRLRAEGCLKCTSCILVAGSACCRRGEALNSTGVDVATFEGRRMQLCDGDRVFSCRSRWFFLKERSSSFNELPDAAQLNAADGYGPLRTCQMQLGAIAFLHDDGLDPFHVDEQAPADFTEGRFG